MENFINFICGKFVDNSSEATGVVVLTDKSKLVVPSKLTSGIPICGNLVAALRKRSQLQEAWTEKKSGED